MRRFLPILCLQALVIAATAFEESPPPLKGLVLWPDEARARPDLSR